MTLNVSAPYGYTIFSDDVRQEVGGKISYIGTYNTELILSNPPPIQLAKLVLSINYFDDPKYANKELRLTVHFPGDAEDKPQVDIKIQAEAPGISLQKISDNEQMLHFVGQLVLAPAKFERLGSFRVKMRRGDVVTRLGNLKVSAQEPPPAPRS